MNQDTWQYGELFSFLHAYQFLLVGMQK